MIPFSKYFWKIGYISMIGKTTITVIVIRTLVVVCDVAAAAARDCVLVVL